MPGSFEQNGTTPNNRGVTQKWATRWGAVAIDINTGAAGTVTGKESKRDAITAAMHDCSSRGSENCEVVTTYYNNCAAVAWGDDGYNVATDNNDSKAMGSAIEHCSAKHGNCKVVYHGCSRAEQMQ
jgi:hypothetical protein